MGEIIVGGRPLEIGATVINWDNDGGFNGYDTSKVTFQEEDRKTGKLVTKTIKGRRYKKTWKRRTVSNIRQFVIHHTGGFRADACFNTLHNRRGLSVQFILGDDGIIYQTLDAVELAWHAGTANGISTGVECVLYPDAAKKPGAYREDRCKRLHLAPHKKIIQTIQGRDRKVYQMPDEQVDALARLVAGVWVARYRFQPSKWTNWKPPLFPGGEDIPTKTIPDALEHDGMLMHYHLSKNKWDAAGIRLREFEILTGNYFRKFIKQTSA